MKTVTIAQIIVASAFRVRRIAPLLFKPGTEETDAAEAEESALAYCLDGDVLDGVFPAGDVIRGVGAGVDDVQVFDGESEVGVRFAGDNGAGVVDVVDACARSANEGPPLGE